MFSKPNIYHVHGSTYIHKYEGKRIHRVVIICQFADMRQMALDSVSEAAHKVCDRLSANLNPFSPGVTYVCPMLKLA